MDSQEIFTTALQYEEKIRDFYRTAEGIIDDERGKAIFRALAKDEQGHVDFLQYSLGQLQKKGAIDIARLTSSIPVRAKIESNLTKMKAKIPERMLGDIKTALGSALILERETSAYYREARDKSEGDIRAIFEKFLKIEERHLDVVQIELDHALHNGMWFNFMEVDLEAY